MSIIVAEMGEEKFLVSPFDFVRLTRYCRVSLEWTRTHKLNLVFQVNYGLDGVPAFVIYGSKFIILLGHMSLWSFAFSNFNFRISIGYEG